MWNLPGPGIEPVSPALAGRFLFTIPQESLGTQFRDHQMVNLQQKMQKLYTFSKNKTWNWQWLRSWTPYCKIQTYIEESRENHSPPLQYSCLENPWTEEPGRLQSMGSLRVRHDWVTSLSLFTFMHWRRKWQPTPVFLPGKSMDRGAW